MPFVDITPRQQALAREKSREWRDLVSGGLMKGYDEGVEKTERQKALQEQREYERGIAEEKELARMFEKDEQRRYQEEQAQKQRDFQEKMLEKRLGAQKKKEGVIAPKLSAGQKKQDEEFAKDFVEFEAKGGYAGVQSDIKKLEAARDALGKYNPRTKKFEANEAMTGPLVGMAPDWAKKRIGLSASVSNKQDVESVVQKNMKLILGGQFTEKEGENVLKRSYDDSLSEEQNWKKIDSLINRMKKQAAAKASASDYFREYGTLKGFKGEAPSREYFAQPEQGYQQQYVNTGAPYDPNTPEFRQIQQRAIQHKDADKYIMWAQQEIRKNPNNPDAIKILQIYGAGGQGGI